MALGQGLTAAVIAVKYYLLAEKPMQAHPGIEVVCSPCLSELNMKWAFLYPVARLRFAHSPDKHWGRH